MRRNGLVVRALSSRSKGRGFKPRPGQCVCVCECVGVCAATTKEKAKKLTIQTLLSQKGKCAVFVCLWIEAMMNEEAGVAGDLRVKRKMYRLIVRYVVE